MRTFDFIIGILLLPILIVGTAIAFVKIGEEAGLLMTLLSLTIIGLSNKMGLIGDSWKDISFENTAEVSNLSKEQIFKGIKLWIAQTFVSAQRVIQYEDIEEGIIVTKGNTETKRTGWRFLLGKKFFGNNQKVCFTMTIRIKNEKFKIDCTNSPENNRRGQTVMIDLSDHKRAKENLEAYVDKIACFLNTEKLAKTW